METKLNKSFITVPDGMTVRDLVSVTEGIDIFAISMGGDVVEFIGASSVLYNSMGDYIVERIWFFRTGDKNRMEIAVAYAPLRRG